MAHNAGFDVGFLKRACAAHDLPWPGFGVLDTVALARGVLLRDEVPNVKLATLARHFRSPTTPDHRALTDARATVDVLHGLMERVGSLGVPSLEELSAYSSRVPAATRRKLLDMAATEKMQVCFYHAPFPATGHIAKAGNGFELVPVQWSSAI